MQIVAVGTDLVQIDRIEDAIFRFGKRFLNRIFTLNELIYCYRQENPYASLAARFAAKEAVYKCFALENIKPGWQDIEIIKEGYPQVVFRGRLRSVSKHYTVSLTLAHERTLAIATAILQKMEKNS